jgi:hypothetical protein
MPFRRIILGKSPRIDTAERCACKKPLDAVYLDFSKVCGKVPHKKVLRKMEGNKSR